MGVHIVIAGHGDFPRALCGSAQMILGHVETADQVELQPGVSLQDFMRQLEANIDDERPTLILTDLRGGTPDNAARVLAHRHPGVRVISNVTLGIVLEVVGWADLDSHSLDQLCQLAGPCVANKEPV